MCESILETLLTQSILRSSVRMCYFVNAARPTSKQTQDLFSSMNSINVSTLICFYRWGFSNWLKISQLSSNQPDRHTICPLFLPLYLSYVCRGNVYTSVCTQATGMRPRNLCCNLRPGLSLRATSQCLHGGPHRAAYFYRDLYNKLGVILQDTKSVAW